MRTMTPTKHPDNSAPIVIRELSTTAEFQQLRHAWNGLLARSRARTVFLTWEWLYTWWEIYGAGRKLRIIVLEQNGTVRAIAPLFQASQLRLRVLQFLGSSRVGSEYLDFILEPGNEEPLLEEILRYLDRAGGWDILRLSDLREQSGTCGLLQRKHAARSIRGDGMRCPYLSLAPTWDALVSGFSKNLRSDLSRKTRRFEQEHRGTFIRIDEERALQESLDRFIGLNRKRMEQKQIVSPFLDPAFAGFHKKVFRLFYETGILRFYAAAVDGPIGYIYIFKYGPTYSFYQMGFDPDWSSVSPGTLLFRYALEAAVAEGVQEFDFLRGDEDYKFRWTREERRTVHYLLFSNTLKNRLLREVVLGSFLTREVLRRIKRKVKGIISAAAERDGEKIPSGRAAQPAAAPSTLNTGSMQETRSRIKSSR